jgi:hypothetical protein
MKGAQRARSKSMKIDRRMRAFAGITQVMKLLFLVASPWIENS